MLKLKKNWLDFGVVGAIICVSTQSPENPIHSDHRQRKRGPSPPSEPMKLTAGDRKSADPKALKKRKKQLSNSDSKQPESKKQTISDVKSTSGEKTKDVKEKNVDDLPGQKHETPGERDPLRIFFETLYRELPDNEIAVVWMMEWGLLPRDEAMKVYEDNLSENQKTETVRRSVSKTKKRKVNDDIDNQDDFISPMKRKQKHKASR